MSARGVVLDIVEIAPGIFYLVSVGCVQSGACIGGMGPGSLLRYPMSAICFTPALFQCACNFSLAPLPQAHTSSQLPPTPNSHTRALPQRPQVHTPVRFAQKLRLTSHLAPDACGPPPASAPISRAPRGHMTTPTTGRTPLAETPHAPPRVAATEGWGAEPELARTQQHICAP
jgi:hypothetical protein